MLWLTVKELNIYAMSPIVKKAPNCLSERAFEQECRVKITGDYNERDDVSLYQIRVDHKHAATHEH